MIQGTVALYLRDDCIISLVYSSLIRRKEIISNWKLQYGKMFNECAIVINPEVDITKVSKDGTNLRQNHIIKKHPPQKGWKKTA